MSIKVLYGTLKNNGDEKWDHLKKVNFYLYLTFLHNPSRPSSPHGINI